MIYLCQDCGEVAVYFEYRYYTYYAGAFDQYFTPGKLAEGNWEVKNVCARHASPGTADRTDPIPS